MRSATVIGLACVLSCVTTGCRRAGEETTTAAVVVIISPHNPHIRSEFSRAFRAWHERNYGQPAELDWREVGGTGQILRFLRGEYEAADKRGVGDGGVGVDVFFGGGPTHEQAKNLGLTAPARIDQDLLAQIPAELNGVRLYDPQH